MWLPLGMPNFVSTKNLVLNSNWWTLWATYLFYQKRIYVSFYQDGIHYCTAHKYSAEAENSAYRLINKLSQHQEMVTNSRLQTHQKSWSFIYLDSVVSVNVEVNCQKQQTYSRLPFLDFAIANLFMILVASLFNIDVHIPYSLVSGCSACLV